MTKLSPLRNNLASLRRRRRSVRWATGLSGAVTAMLWLLAGAALLDVAWQASVAVRFVVLVCCGLGTLWAWSRLASPHLHRKETDLEMALMVQRQHSSMSNVGRDLVAALQFESPTASEWGSPRLEAVVVDSVAGYSDKINVYEGFSSRQLSRRSSALAVTVVVVIGTAVAFPGHAESFLNRFFLGAMHYPSATIIERVTINGSGYELTPGGPVTIVRCAQGQPLHLVVECSGVLPQQGSARLLTDSGQSTSIVLASAGSSSDGTAARYQGSLERLGDPLSFQIYIGDAWTDPARIELIAMPVVEIALSTTPPDYAKRRATPSLRTPSSRTEPAKVQEGRNLEVLEGASVGLRIACHNKSLSSAELIIGEDRFPLATAGKEKKTWRLDPKGTPFEHLSAETGYRIEVVDVDGLSPEHPPQGVIRIKLDQPPRISATIKTRHVVPTGIPVIEYRVDDDYGVTQLRLHSVIRRDGSDGMQVRRPDPIDLRDGSVPLPSDRLPHQGRSTLQLSRFDLRKGDRLELRLEVVDYRGTRAGKSASTDVLHLTVTDAAGVQAAVAELDPALEQQFDSLIQRELDIGASK